jgi:hypothetical protein
MKLRKYEVTFGVNELKQTFEVYDYNSYAATKQAKKNWRGENGYSDNVSPDYVKVRLVR